MNSANAVAVSGMGVVSPAGSTLADLWDSQLCGVSPAELRTDLAGGNEFPYLACRVSDFDLDSAQLSAKEARRLDPFARFALGAALTAWEHAGRPTPLAGRGAVVVGNAVGGRSVTDDQVQRYAAGGVTRVNPMMPIMTMPNAAAAQIAIRLGWSGPAWTVATTCASGADAIGQAAMLLNAGQADIVLAGGCEASISPVTIAAFNNLNAMSRRFDDPTRACRPFDRDRDGFVMGEGAAFVVLERLTDVIDRGSTPQALLIGYAATTDAQHMTMPSASGSGAIASMAQALERSAVVADEISFVNAHGTSTPLNDEIEALAIRKVLGEGVPVTATKGVTGHMIGASGAVEFISTVQSLQHGLVPPIANHVCSDEGAEIDIVYGRPRSIGRGPALSNSFGFGGHNTSLVVAPV